MRSDGTIFFTDPDFGLPSPADREISFNGVFRIDQAGGLTAEWQGDASTQRPNGIGLSPDETTLYVSDWQSGVLLAFDVASNGELSNERTFASGLNGPDGMCIDRNGNILVGTRNQTIEAFAPDGSRWGSISIPRNVTNCAFGGDLGRTLFATAIDGLYSVEVLLPGTP